MVLRVGPRGSGLQFPRRFFLRAMSDLSALSRRRHRRFLFLIAVLTGLAGLSWWGTRSLPPAEPRAVGDSGNEVPGQIPPAKAPPAVASNPPLMPPAPSTVSSLWHFVPPPAAATVVEARVEAPTREFRYLDLNAAALTGKRAPFNRPGAGEIVLPLPDGRAVTATIDRTQILGPDRFVSEGRVPGYPHSRFMLAYRDGHVSASLEGVTTGEIKVRTLDAAGLRVVQFYEVDSAQKGQCEVVPLPAAAAQIAASAAATPVLAGSLTRTTARAQAQAAAPLVSGQAAVDLLMVYTSAVRAAFGGAAAIETEIDLAVAKVNSDFAASGISARIQLAGTLEVDYAGDETETPQTGWQDDALERLVGVTDGYMDEVHAAREALGADMVSLVVQRPDNPTVGIAYLLEDLGGFVEPFFAFSVLHYAELSDATVLSHELGHNFGCAHDRENAGAAPERGYHGAFAHSYGYRIEAVDTGGTKRRFCTIMAYPGGTRLRYFSNPQLSISSYNSGVGTINLTQPVALGVASGGAAADNARTIEQTAFQVAGYRLSPDRGAAGRLVNVSTRAYVGSGYQTLIGGFVVNGTGSRRVLLRAPGPALGALGVADTLSDPVLRIDALATGTVYTNNDWGLPAADASAIAAAASQVGAFPFDNGSRDAALLLDLAPGNYTAQVSGAGGAQGYALVEAYEVGDAGGARLVNISTRAYASREAPIIAGFVVRPEAGREGERKTMFIRVRGPSLTAYGLPADVVMGDPEMEIYDAGAELVYYNDDWDGPSALLHEDIPVIDRGVVDQPSEQAVYDAGLSLGDSSAMLPVEPGAVIELPAGIYTVMVRPFEALPDQPAAPGVAIVEVYELTP